MPKRHHPTQSKQLLQQLQQSKRLRQSKQLQQLKQTPAPKKTAFRASHVCWDVVLSNQHAAVALGSWSWLWKLGQVFGTLPHADQMMKWMCAADSRPVIWKKKANELFALTPQDLLPLHFETVLGNSWRQSYEVHLLFRSDVLKVALEKHGGSFAGINAAFIARKCRNAKRKRPERHHHSQSRRICYYDSDNGDYE